MFFRQQVKRQKSQSAGKIRPMIKNNDLCMEVLKCKECNKTFATKSGFERHSQHHTGKYSHFCSICRKGYNNGYNYELHMRKHEGRGFPCEFCGKVFSSGQMKDWHESEHTGIYRFTCETCGKGYNKNSQYNNHVASHDIKAVNMSLSKQRI